MASHLSFRPCSVLLCFTLLLISPLFPAASAQNGPIFACDVENNPGLKEFAFCDASLSVKHRVKALVDALTLPEKIMFLVSKSGGFPRLGIPQYEWWSEALHGVSSVGGGVRFTGPIPGATSFPAPILTAASFNKDLFLAIGKAVSTEARAMHNAGLAGLTFWSPNINIFRDPRWGRGQETPGEDPTLTAQYGVAYVKGLQQSRDGEKLKVAACCKHYTAYDLDKWKGVERYTFSANVTEQDMHETFQPPFEACVKEGNVASVMCSYNKVNGKPTCGDPNLLNGVVRGQWNLNGYIVTDCDSLDIMFNSQHYTKTKEETAALALNSGVDLNCGSFLGSYTQGAVNQGLVNESEINRAVTNNFATLMRLGFFDGNPKNNKAYGHLGPSDVCTQENQELAREAARQGIVLLKNSAGSLPLSPNATKSLAVIGPNANATITMISNYAGTPCRYTSPLQGLMGVVANTVYSPGCDNVGCVTARVDDAKKAAAEADAVVLVMGSDLSIEQESLDRTDITLPGQQSVLVSEVAKVAKGRPVILVIMSGSGMDVQFAKDDPSVTSILWVGFPGEAGGAALADVVFGLHNPSGRLPMTWYPQSYVDSVPMTDMRMRPAPGFPGRTYRYYKGPTVFEFGHGLSYSTFKHAIVRGTPRSVSLLLDEQHVCRLASTNCKSVEVAESICKDSTVFDVRLRVKNSGGVKGGHTVLLHAVPPSVHNAPQRKLVAFEKVHLHPNEEVVVGFRVNVCKHLSVVDEVGKKRVPLGHHRLHIGDLEHPLIITL